jgi:hypothetical protein
MLKVITNDICMQLIISKGIRLCRFKRSRNNEKIRIRPKNANHRSNIRMKIVFEYSIWSSNDWWRHDEIVKQRKIIA